ERNDRVWHALATVAVKLAGALDLLQIVLDAGDAFLDQPAVGFKLTLARAAEEAEAAALAFEMGPGAHQAALLVGQVRVLALEGAGARMRAASKDFEDQAGAVDHLRAPGLLEIALLDRRERAVHDHNPGFVGLDEAGDLLDLALADIGRGPNVADRHDARRHHRKIDGAGEPDRLIKLGLGRAHGERRVHSRSARRAPAPMRLDYDRTPAARAFLGLRAIALPIEPAGLQLGLFPGGGRLLGPFEQLDRMTRHDRRDRVLVNQLRVPVATQKHAEIIEPGHDALQFNPVDQKDRERSFVLSDMVQEGVLEIL